MVLCMAFLLSFLGVLQPCGDRVRGIIYSIHIHHWLIQQYNDTCCFVLFVSEIAIKSFHIRKELLWYHRLCFVLFFFLLHGYRFGCQVHQLSNRTWGPEENVRKSFMSLLCSGRKPLRYPQLWAHVIYYWPSVEKKVPTKNPFRDHKEIFGLAKKCLQGCSLCCLCLAWGKTMRISFECCQYGIFHHYIIYF